MYLDPRDIKKLVEESKFKRIFNSATGCSIICSYHDPTKLFPENTKLLLEYNNINFSVGLIRLDSFYEDHSVFKLKFIQNNKHLIESEISVYVDNNSLSELSTLELFENILVVGTLRYIKVMDDRYLE
jgi:hypothetical protein